MFTEEAIPRIQQRFQAEVLAPLDEQLETKMALARQVYPQATKPMVLAAFFIIGFILNRILDTPVQALEERLDIAAERVFPMSKLRKSKKRRLK